MAFFHSFGTVPVDNEKLIMLATVGTSRSLHCLSRRVGMGSNAPVLDGASAISSETVSIETLSNNESSHMLRTEHNCVEEVGEGCGIQHCSSRLVFSIFSEKILSKLICEYFRRVMWR